MGEAIYCGGFWRQGHEDGASYLMLEQGSGRTILATSDAGLHRNFGAATASSAADFAALAKAFLARS